MNISCGYSSLKKRNISCGCCCLIGQQANVITLPPHCSQIILRNSQNIKFYKPTI